MIIFNIKRKQNIENKLIIYMKMIRNKFFSPYWSLILLITLSKLLLNLSSTSVSNFPNLILDFLICFNLFNFLFSFLAFYSLLITL